MKQSKSGVFFIDILGFSALTKGLIKGITEDDYRAWGLRASQFNHSFLSAKIILEFRSVLKLLKTKYPKIKIGQLSDCAFIWSKDIVLLMQAVHFMMWTMVDKKGILCRGGMSYGDIVEIDKVDHKLGAFIVGDAATNAVKNEGQLKGPRVTMDLSVTDVLQQKMRRDSVAMLIAHDLFHNIESMIDMSQVDEYRWYLCDDDIIASSTILGKKEKIELTKRRLKLANVLRFHPRMGWNTRGQEGLLQLKAGVKSLTENGLFGILHNFETREVGETPRLEKYLHNLNKSVEGDRYYTREQENEWKANLLNL